MIVDLFEKPDFLLSPEFDAYKCSVLGIKLGASADELKDFEAEHNEADWFHIEGGVAFHVKDYAVCKIKLPRSILERLEIRTIEDLIGHLGKHDDVREMRYRDRLRHCTYLWDKGISAFWQIVPKLEPHNLAIFDPVRGYEHWGEMSFRLPSAKDCLERLPPFQIPPSEAVKNLKPGDLAKLIFDIEINSKSFVERMWVEVTEVKPEFYNGLLINDAYCTHDLKRQTPVQFHADHVIEIMRKEDRE